MNENNSQNAFKCSGDCLKCSFQQRVYCSSQMSRNSMDILGEIVANQRSMIERISSLEEAVRDNGGKIVNPMEETPSDALDGQNSDEAQDDAGAENRASL